MQEFLQELLQFRKKIIKSLIDIKLTQYNPNYYHETIVPNATYSPWNTHTEFQEVFAVASQRTLIDIYRAYNLWDLVTQTNQLEGDILEVGVWRGGTACIITRASKGRGTVYLADTFEGVVKTGANDSFYKGGEHADASEEDVRGGLDGLAVKNYHILKGIFPDDHSTKVQDLKFRFCHIDVDVYQSALDVFEYVWPRLAIGGAVVFDDYGFLRCEGVTKLIDEMTLTNGIKMYNLNGQAVIIKHSA